MGIHHHGQPPGRGSHHNVGTAFLGQTGVSLYVLEMTSKWTGTKAMMLASFLWSSGSEDDCMLESGSLCQVEL